MSRSQLGRGQEFHQGRKPGDVTEHSVDEVASWMSGEHLVPTGESHRIMEGDNGEHFTRKVAGLEKSMRSYGFMKSMPVEATMHAAWMRNPEGPVFVDGHHRFHAARKAGVKTIPVKWT